MPHAPCRLIVPITASSPEAMLGQARAALDGGADLVELRLDFLEGLGEQDLEGLVRELGDRCIITLRPVDEGGRFDGAESDRIRLLTQAAQGRPRFADIEYRHLKRWGDLSWKIGPTPGHPRLILSLHDCTGRPAKLQRTIQDMAAEPDCSVVKAAWSARHIADNFEAFDLLRAVPKPMIAVCMGESGLLSRVLAAKFGAFGTYCSLGAGRESAPGQLPLAEMKELYRFDRIDADTQVYGVVGCPLAHSMSPAIFNAAFEQAEINAVYLPMLVQPAEDDFRDFVREMLARPWLGIGGLSVTLPHKEHAFRLCREALDEVSLASGAVNTLIVTGEKMAGLNTDAPAALEALTVRLGCAPKDLSGVPVDVLGAGGVARAVLAALSNCGCKLTVYNRTPQRSAALAGRFDCQAKPWEERTARQGQVLINCTSVGMWPHSERTPLPAAGLESCPTVFDAVYNPAVTRLLSEAEACGCKTVSGVEMFVRQAMGQFEAWTGRRPPHDLMAEVIRTRLAQASSEDEAAQ